MSDDGDKKFDPTPQRREEFRKQGRFARARDAGGVAVTAGVLATLLGSHSAMSRATDLLFASTLGNVTALTQGGAGRVFEDAGESLLVMAAPSIFVAAGAGALAGLAQAGVRINTENLGFKPERLNPLPKLKELFSFKKGGVEAAMSALRVLVVGYVAYRALLVELPRMLLMTHIPAADAMPTLIDMVVRVVMSALGALVVIAAIDYAQSRFSLEREMKMTRKELMDEMKSSDGDQKVKHKMRAQARAAAKKRALSKVQEADVIVTNPTHIAVALRYSAKDPAPVVIAKGHDELALQIRAKARKLGIPIMENRPLARALDAEVKLGHPVPAAHFAAVARILAFVYRLKKRGTPRA